MKFEGGGSSRLAMDRVSQVVEETLSLDFGRVAIVTHGNLMTLLLKNFDDRFGFQDWANLSNPDVFLVTIGGVRTTVERVWA